MSEKVKGLDIYVEINTGTEQSPVWTKVGGQKGASMSPSLSALDTTDKDSDGWEESIPGNRSFGVEFDSFLIEDDAGYAELIDGYWIPELKHLRLTTKAYTYTGKFLLSEMPHEAPHDDMSGVSFSLKASGAVTKAAVSN